MKKKIIAIMAIVMFVLVMPFSANLQNISANQTRAISYANPSITANRKTGNIGDKIDSTISGLSFDKIEMADSSEHFGSINYNVYGQSGYYNHEFLNRMLAFEGLEVGGATAKDASGNAIGVETIVAVNFNTYPSTTKPMTLYNFKIVMQPANQKIKISISKQELEEFSKKFGYTLENLAEIRVIYKSTTNNTKLAAMDIDDSIYRTSIVNDMQVMRSTDTYARVNLRAYATAGNNYHQTSSEFKADYVRFNTLDMEVTCNKDSFIPGEQITMTWTLTNTGSYNNSFVYMGMDYGKTGLIEVPNQNDTSTIIHTDWTANPNDELYIAFIDNNVTPRKWQVFQSGGVYKISKTFQVNEDFLEEKILFDNFTMINGDYTNRKIVPFTLMLKNYTIQFETNGGNVIAPTQVYHGRKLTQPDTPVKKGYTFEGWYQDKELMIPWSFNNDIVNEDKTLYAKWKLEEKVNDIIDFNDFEHNNKDGELKIEDIFEKGNVTIKDSNGNSIKNSDLKYNQNELDKLNDAIKKNEAGIYSITFKTPLGSEFTIKITTIKYTSTIIVQTDNDENSGNGMHNNKVNTYDNSNITNALILLGISGLTLSIIYAKKLIDKV